MTAYYPSQAGTAYGAHPVMYQNSGYAMGSAYGAQPMGMGGVMGVPQVAPAAPMVAMQPTVAAAGYGGQPMYGQYPPRFTFGQRMRMFFGLSPVSAFKYRSERTTWGFMGYSRRQRYIDPRTGGEVDRDGRPVMRM